MFVGVCGCLWVFVSVCGCLWVFRRFVYVCLGEFRDVFSFFSH